MRVLTIIISFGLAFAPVLAVAGHSELTVPKADTFLLGGDQKSPMDVSGKNVGTTPVAITALMGEVETAIAEVAPGQKFAHRFAPGEIAALRNLSPTTEARLSVDFTGSPASLAMRYVLPQKD